MDQAQRLALECRRLADQLAKRDARIADLEDRLRERPGKRSKSELARENDWLRRRLAAVYEKDIELGS